MTSLQSASAAPILEVNRQLELAIPATQAWQLVANFGSLEDWHPAIARTEILAGTNNVVGALRRLTVMDGRTLEEKLIAYQPQQMRQEYIITTGALPGARYSARISVRAIAPDRALVNWNATFERAHPSPTPAAGRDDEAGLRVITGIFDSGLASLAQIVADRRQIEAVLKQAPEPRPGTAHVDAIDLKGRAASARVSSDAPNQQTVEFFLLQKIEDRWSIVGRILNRTDKS